MDDAESLMLWAKPQPGAAVAVLVAALIPSFARRVLDFLAERLLEWICSAGCRGLCRRRRGKKDDGEYEAPFFPEWKDLSSAREPSWRDLGI